MNNITHPITFKTYDIFSQEGISLLKQYISIYQTGGAGGGAKETDAEAERRRDAEAAVSRQDAIEEKGLAKILREFAHLPKTRDMLRGMFKYESPPPERSNPDEIQIKLEAAGSGIKLDKPKVNKNDKVVELLKELKYVGRLFTEHGGVGELDLEKTWVENGVLEDSEIVFLRTDRIIKLKSTFSNNTVKKIKDIIQKVEPGIVYDICIRSSHIDDVSPFGRENVKALRLYDCHRVKDVSSLENMETVVLNLTSVRNVSSLGNVKALHLSTSGPNEITDVSSLGNVKKLGLAKLQGVWDVSSLGDVETLYIYDCPVVDVSSLGTVKTLILIKLPVVDVSSLGTVETLILDRCPNIVDVSSLGNVPNLKIKDCGNIPDVLRGTILKYKT